jgi:hypothetical protein
MCVCVGRVYKYKTTTGGKILFPALNIINALYILGVGVGSSSVVFANVSYWETNSPLVVSRCGKSRLLLH